MHSMFAVSGQQILWGTLWSGLVLLTMALLVLMRTHWGQSQPLRKCVVLSLLAHLLFGCYATTIGIVHSTSRVVAETSSVRITSIEADSTESNSDESVQPSPITSVQPEPAQTISQTEAGDAPISAAPPQPAPEAELQQLQETRLKPELQPEQPVAEASMPPSDENGLEEPPLDSAELALSADSDPQPSIEDDLPSPQVPEVAASAAESEVVTPADDLMPVPKDEGGRTKDERGSPPSSSFILRPPSIPPEPTPPVPAVLKLRVAHDRGRQALLRGGTATSEAAVQAALQWLANHQSADGHWDASRFQSGRELRTLGQERPGAGAKADSGVTGLALLAFLGAGHTHLHGPYQQAVERGLEYLRNIQGHDGRLGGNASTYELMYCHGMATIALSEAYALTQDARLESPVRRAISYTLTAQHPSTGGWRYRPGDLGDTSQLGWQLMALKSAELGGIPIPARARDGMLRYLRSVTTGRHGGLASYRPAELPSRTMTAEALASRQFLGLPLDEPTAAEAAAYLMEEPPSVEQTNVYYWYYATLALFRLQGEAWRQWNDALQAALVSQQRNDGDLAGSWDPDPVWGGYGGRVYSTALSTLCLEVYYRYLPLHQGARD